MGSGTLASIGMTAHRDWNESYREGNLPWDTGKPSSELQRVASRKAIRPCRALELGCGTGTNSVRLAQQGFGVTGVDVAPLAIEQAEKRAQTAGVQVQYIVSDLFQLSKVGEPYEFFFDRGCYHTIRRKTPGGYHGRATLVVWWAASSIQRPRPNDLDWLVSASHPRLTRIAACRLLRPHRAPTRATNGCPARSHWR